MKNDAVERVNDAIKTLNAMVDGKHTFLLSDNASIGLAVKALQKQKPMRCEYTERDNAFFVKSYERKCPACGDIILVSHAALPYEKFCRACGQRITEGMEE